MLEDRMEENLSKLDFFKIFLEQKSRMEGSSRSNLMFLVENMRKSKQIESDINKVREDLEFFFDEMKFKTKYQIEKELVKMKCNIVSCSQKLNQFYFHYFGNRWIYFIFYSDYDYDILTKFNS